MSAGIPFTHNHSELFNSKVTKCINVHHSFQTVTAGDSYITCTTRGLTAHKTKSALRCPYNVISEKGLWDCNCSVLWTPRWEATSAAHTGFLTHAGSTSAHMSSCFEAPAWGTPLHPFPRRMTRLCRSQMQVMGPGVGVSFPLISPGTEVSCFRYKEGKMYAAESGIKTPNASRDGEHIRAYPSPFPENSRTHDMNSE